MNQEGGKEKMLTYEAKRTLLEAFLSDNVNHNDSCYCVWVCDLDDSTVYFSYDGKYFMAPYAISQDEEGNGIVSVSLEEKQAVVRSWSVFTEESSEAQENSETFEANSETENVDNSQQENFTEEKPENEEDNKETESCENKENESCVDSTNCFDDDQKDNDDESKDDDVDDKDDKDEDNKETESCENKETESCVDSTDCFENPEEKEEDNKEDNKEIESCENKETESVEDEGKKKEEFCVDSTNCFSSESESTTREFVTIGEENLNIDELLEKYTALDAEFSALNAKFTSLDAEYQVLFAQEQERQLNNMINFGYELVDAESRLTDDEQKKFIKEQIKDKCEKGEFADNDALKSFTVTQLALALYNSNSTTESNTNNKADFCVDIVIPETKHVESDAEKLRNLTKKLNRI